MKLKLLLVNGSVRERSSNGAVLETLRVDAPEGVEAIVYGGLDSLPHFNPDLDPFPRTESSPTLPPAVIDLRAQLSAADAVMFCTPEYAGTLPGAFKNMLDWAVGEGLNKKPVGWINSSAHGGAQGAYQTLRGVMTYMQANMVPKACVDVPVARDGIGSDGIVKAGDARTAMLAAARALCDHVRQVQG